MAEILKWTDVTNNPEYTKLSEDEKNGIKLKYFNNVIVPNVSKDEVEVYRKKFLGTSDKPVITKDIKAQPTWGAKKIPGQDFTPLLSDIEKMKVEIRNPRENYLTKGGTDKAILSKLQAEENTKLKGLEQSRNLIQPTGTTETATGVYKDTTTNKIIAEKPVESDLLDDPIFTAVMFGTGSGVMVARGGATPLRVLAKGAKEAMSDLTYGISDLTKWGVKTASNLRKSKVLSREVMYEDMLQKAMTEGTPQDVELLKKNFTRLDADAIAEANSRKITSDKVLSNLGVHVWDDKYNVRKGLETVSKDLEKEAKALRLEQKQLTKNELTKGGSTQVVDEQAKAHLDKIKLRLSDIDMISKSANHAVERRILQHGAAANAENIMQEADALIFGDLNQLKSEKLGELREAFRSSEVAGREMLVAGSKTEHDTFLKYFDDAELLKKNEQIDTIYKNQLQKLSDEGLITPDAVTDMLAKGEHYNPRLILERLDPVLSVNGRKIGSVSNMAYLEGSEKTLYKDPRYLLQDYIGKTESMIFKNRANKALYDFAEKAPDNGIVKIIEKGERAKTLEDTIKVKIGGIEKEMIMPKQLAAEWKGLDPLLQQQWANGLSRWSGNKLLKTMATGVNPFFPIRNIMRDAAYIYMSPEYSSFLPKFIGQAVTDYASVAQDAIKNTGLAKEYLKFGGGLGAESLTRSGRLTDKYWKKTQDVLGAFGELSERWTRLAHMNRAMKNRAVDGVVSEADKVTSAFIARDALDFGQGGLTSKAMNNVLPYFNAGIQGTRGMIKFATKDPKGFTLKMANLAGVSSALYYYNTVNYKEDHDKIPAYLKDTNWIIMTPLTFIDGEGEEQRRFITIPKDFSQQIFTTMADIACQAVMGHEINTEQLEVAAKNFFDIVPGSGAGVPPLLRAIGGYFQNIDSYRNQDIWKAEDYAGKIKPGSEWTERTPEIWKKTGGATGTSPERLKYAIEQFYSSNNPIVNMFGMGLNTIMKDMDKEEKAKLSDEIVKELGMGLFRRTYSDYGMMKKVKDSQIDVNTERFEDSRTLKQDMKKNIPLEETIQKFSNLRKDSYANKREGIITSEAIKEIIGPKNNKTWQLIANSKTPEAAARGFFNAWKDKPDYKEAKMKAGALKKIYPSRFGNDFFAFLSELESKQKK